MKRPVLCLAFCLAAAGPGGWSGERSTSSAEPSAPPAISPPARAADTPAAPRPDDPPPGEAKAASEAAAPKSPVWVSAEIRFPTYFSSLFYAFSAGDPIHLRLLIHNVSEGDVEVARDLDVLGSLQVATPDDRRLDPDAEWKSKKSVLPARLAPGQILGGLYDLSEIFPTLRKPGNYAIRWESGDWKSNTVGVRVIEAYNPQAGYEATIETETGEITLALNPREAPLHVRNFVALARLGYYNDLPFHSVARDRSIRTGAPGADGTGSIGYYLPAEPSSLKHVAGAVSMYRDQRMPGSESDGTQFFICVTDIPNRDGKFTVFGNVSKGLEIAKKISERETLTDPKRPAGTPVEPVKIKRVVIVEKPGATKKG